MRKKLTFLVNFLKLRFSSKVKLQGFVRIENNVEFILDKNSKLNLGKGVYIRKNCVIGVSPYAVLELGENVFLAHGVTVAAAEKIKIGNNTMVAEYTSIRDSDHAYNTTGKTLAEKGNLSKPVNIGKNVWLGNKVTVTKGVTIGDNSVIGANSVVTKDIAAKSVAVGTPAKVIKKIK